MTSRIAAFWRALRQRGASCAISRRWFLPSRPTVYRTAARPPLQATSSTTCRPGPTTACSCGCCVAGLTTTAFGPGATPLNCCTTKPASPCRRHGPRSTEGFPAVCAVAASHLHWRQDLRVEVSQAHAVQHARLGLRRFPMRHAPACCATHGLRCLVALYVRLGNVPIAGRPHRAVFAVGPKSAHPPADGAATVRGLLRSERQFDREGATAAASCKQRVRRWWSRLRTKPQPTFMMPNTLHEQ